MELKYKSWDDITLPVWNRLQLANLAGTDENDKSIKIAAILAGVSQKEVEAMPFTEYLELLRQSEFIGQKPEVQVRHEYELGGRLYTLKLQPERITTSQFIDYQTLAKSEPENEAKLLSVCLIPKGHDYGDGYELKEVEGDIVKHLSYPDFVALKLFFWTYCEELQKATLTCSAQKAVKQEIPWWNLPKRMKARSLIRDFVRSGNG